VALIQNVHACGLDDETDTRPYALDVCVGAVPRRCEGDDFESPANNCDARGGYVPLQMTNAVSVVVPLLPGPVEMKFTIQVPAEPPPVG
jgi:hypothetical protein